MAPDSVDVVITSPPYNLGDNGHKQGEYSSIKDNMNIEEYFQFIIVTIQELLRVTKWHIFFNIQENSGNFGIVRELRKHFDDYLKETFIWVKTNPQPTFNPKQIVSAFEYIFCFSKDNPHNRQFTHCTFDNKNKIEHQNVFLRPVNNDIECREHHFRFPEWLPKYFIKNFSYEKEIIYDPFMGSGTTAKGCIELNRNYVGSEISPEYCDIAERRLQPYKSNIDMFYEQAKNTA